jgi:hypothetical protein
LTQAFSNLEAFTQPKESVSVSDATYSVVVQLATVFLGHFGMDVGELCC